MKGITTAKSDESNKKKKNKIKKYKKKELCYTKETAHT